MVDWAKDQSDDRDLAIMLEYLQHGKEPTEAELFLESPSSKHMWIDKENFCLQQGVLYRKKRDGDFQRVVPKSLKQKIWRYITIFHLRDTKALKELSLG